MPQQIQFRIDVYEAQQAQILKDERWKNTWVTSACHIHIEYIIYFHTIFKWCIPFKSCLLSCIRCSIFVNFLLHKIRSTDWIKVISRMAVTCQLEKQRWQKNSSQNKNRTFSLQKKRHDHVKWQEGFCKKTVLSAFMNCELRARNYIGKTLLVRILSIPSFLCIACLIFWCLRTENDNNKINYVKLKFGGIVK